MSGMFIPVPDLIFYPSQIPDPRVKKAPDPYLQHWLLTAFICKTYLRSRGGLGVNLTDMLLQVSRVQKQSVAMVTKNHIYVSHFER
jgi:hypothetical protein